MLSEFENSRVKVRGGRNMSHCVLQGASNLLCFAKKESHIAVLGFVVCLPFFSATGECETEG